MRLKKYLLLTFLFITFFTQYSVAQLAKANKLYEAFKYEEAIPYFQKEAKRHNQEAIEKLLNCYRLLHRYSEAEKYFEEEVGFPNYPPIMNLYYGEALMNNGKLPQAKEQFKLYSSKVAGDKRAETFLNSCIMTKLWAARQPQHKVRNIEEINSELAEFGAVKYRDGGIVFTSERNQDLVNNTKFSWTERPYLSVFHAKISSKDSTKFDRLRAFHPKINDEYHNGPVSFNKGFTEAYFTRVEKKLYGTDEAKTNRPQIYISKYKGGNWGKAEPFQWNSPIYSEAHPSISMDGQLLYFASDMPGGYGGKDIYVSKREGAGWSKPVNVGGKINTTGDEVFPYIHNNGTLYYSSNGHITFGGLDIFYNKSQNGQWGQAVNMQSAVNSNHDDFSISFTEGNKRGYFASNRDGGKGDDDIYYFSPRVEIKISAISGKIYINELDPAKNFEVKLFNEMENLIQTTTTDGDGAFKFEGLDPKEDYVVSLNAEEIGLDKLDEESYLSGRLIYNNSEPAANATLVIKNREKDVVHEMVTDDKGFFRYQKLGVDDASMSQIDDDAAELALRKIFEYQKLNSSEFNLDKLSEEDTYAAVKKMFNYQKLNSDQFSLEGMSEADIQMALKKIFEYRKLHPEEASLSTIDDPEETEMFAKKVHQYTKLKYDESSEMGLLELTDEELELKTSRVIEGTVMVGSKMNKIGKNLAVTLYEDDGTKVKESTTDDAGFFKFADLEYDKSYVVAIEPAQTSKIEFRNKNGEVYKTIISDKKGQFSFKRLEADDTSLDGMELDETEMKVRKHFVFNRLEQLNQALEMMEGDDTEFAANRKTKTIVVRTMIGEELDEFASGVKVFLYSEDGVQLQESITDSVAITRFENLAPDGNYVIMINEYDKKLLGSQQYKLVGRLLVNGKQEEPYEYKKISSAGLGFKAIDSTKTDIDGFYSFERTSPYFGQTLESMDNVMRQDSIGDTDMNAEQDSMAFNTLAARNARMGNMGEDNTNLNRNAEGTVYKAQIGAYMFPERFNYSRAEKFGKVEKKLETDGVTRFTLTNDYASFDEANTMVGSLRGVGVKDAFVTGVRDGNRIVFDRKGNEVDNTFVAKVPIKKVEQRATQETQAIETEEAPSINNADVDTGDMTYKELVNQFGKKKGKNITFRVQVGAFNMLHGIHYQRLQTIGPVEKKKYDDGVTRFTIGNVQTLEEAENIRIAIVKKGQSDAFVIAIYNGKRIPLKDLIKQNFYNPKY